MHCGSLSQRFAESLQKETKQVTEAEIAAQGYLSRQVQANATETTLISPKEPEALLLQIRGGHSEAHGLRKTAPQDHRRFTELGHRWREL